MNSSKKDRIYLSPPDMRGNELNYIKSAFESNWIAPVGPNIDLFEQQLEDYLGESSHVVALSSGTAAIHLALTLLGLSPGDLVLCQSFTFIATANPIIYLGAEPIFVDSEQNSWNICPVLLEKAIKVCIDQGKLPKAIVVVHLYGHPCQMNNILVLSEKYGIPIIEDAAEALGSRIDNRACGTFGDYGVLSFNGNKIITTSGGGALICKNKEQKQRALFYASQAKEPVPYYLHNKVGYNYRMSNVLAGIGCGQMEILESFVNNRRTINQFYKDKFRHIESIEMISQSQENISNCWLSCILTQSFEHKERIMAALNSENIESRSLWNPLHQQPCFSNNEHWINGVSDELFSRGICLPSGSALQEEQLERIASIVLNI